MESFATITRRGELMVFTAKDATEANYICGGDKFIELEINTPGCSIFDAEDLHGYLRDIYNELKK